MMTVQEASLLLEQLKAAYPSAGPELVFSNAYETLVATILSAQCTDARVNQVTPALFRAYPDAASMANAQVPQVYEMVRSCGFKSKAANIVAACQMIMERYHGEVPRTMEELTSLPGVGRKTASVVLLAAYHIPAMPVDTHVFRVSNRLGLAAAKTVEETERQICAAYAPEEWYFLHHALILHGRRVCHSQRPACEVCPFKAMCSYIQK